MFTETHLILCFRFQINPLGLQSTQANCLRYGSASVHTLRISTVLDFVCVVFCFVCLFVVVFGGMNDIVYDGCIIDVDCMTIV